MTSWKEDLARMKEMLVEEGDLDAFRKSNGRRLTREPRWRALSNLPHLAMPVLLALGADVLRNELTAIAAIVEPALQDFHQRSRKGPHDISITTLEFADALNIFGCTGSLDDAEQLLAALKPYLVTVKTSRDEEFVFAHWNRALMALALDDPRTWKPIAGLLPEQQPTFKAGAHFQFNVQGLIVHLGGALTENAPLGDVLPAWRDFLRCAPILRETNQIDENTCLWVARIIHHHIGGDPLASVGEFLHSAVHELAAAE